MAEYIQYFRMIFEMMENAKELATCWKFALILQLVGFASILYGYIYTYNVLYISGCFIFATGWIINQIINYMVVLAQLYTNSSIVKHKMDTLKHCQEAVNEIDELTLPGKNTLKNE